MSNDFSHFHWQEEFTLFPLVPALAVYPNTHGDAVIIQSGAGDAKYVIIPRDQINALVKRLKEVRALK